MNESVESKILQRRGVVASKQDLAILTCEKVGLLCYLTNFLDRNKY